LSFEGLNKLFKTIPELFKVVGLLSLYLGCSFSFYFWTYLFSNVSSFSIKIAKGAFTFYLSTSFGGRYILKALEALDYSTLKEYSCKIDSAILDFYFYFYFY
jgi:hypothetical protein